MSTAKPSTSVSTEANGRRSRVRRSIARLVSHPGQKTSSYGVPAISAARMVGDHSLSRPVARRRFHRSMTVSERACISRLSSRAVATRRCNAGWRYQSGGRISLAKLAAFFSHSAAPAGEKFRTVQSNLARAEAASRLGASVRGSSAGGTSNPTSRTRAARGGRGTVAIGSKTGPSRRFPSPWHADPMPGGYVARDATGQAGACLHLFPRDRARQAKMLAKNEAQRIAIRMRDCRSCWVRRIAAKSGKLRSSRKGGGYVVTQLNGRPGAPTHRTW
jgi:hypothetical protein